MPQTPLCNISQDGRNFRLFLGVLLVVFSLFLAALLSVSAAPLPLRAIVFLPAWVSMLCLFQARASTCVFLAARGEESTSEGTRPVADAGRAAALQSLSAGIHLRSLVAGFLLTVALTVGFALVPWSHAFAA